MVHARQEYASLLFLKVAFDAVVRTGETAVLVPRGTGAAKAEELNETLTAQQEEEFHEAVLPQEQARFDADKSARERRAQEAASREREWVRSVIVEVSRSNENNLFRRGRSGRLIKLPDRRQIRVDAREAPGRYAISDGSGNVFEVYGVHTEQDLKSLVEVLVKERAAHGDSSHRSGGSDIPTVIARAAPEAWSSVRRFFDPPVYDSMKSVSPRPSRYDLEFGRWATKNPVDRWSVGEPVQVWQCTFVEGRGESSQDLSGEDAPEDIPHMSIVQILNQLGADGWYVVQVHEDREARIVDDVSVSRPVSIRHLLHRTT